MDIHKIKNTAWNKNYTTGEFVTGTTTQEIFNWHEIQLPVNKLVLDIGVGHGVLIKDLSKNNTMIGVDVSDDILEKISPSCKAVYLSKELNKIEKVDLAVCNLVLQHNHEFEVTRIINDTNLVDGGILSFQFASLNLEKSKLTSLILNDLNNSMLYFYSKEKMRDIVSRTNKKIIKEIGPLWFSEPYNFEWYIFHVINK